MGTWSHEPFGNDNAGDWGYGIVSCADLSYIEAALDKVLARGTEYLDAPDAEEAVAAIEVTAKLLGKGTQQDAYTEDVDAWVKAAKVKPSAELKAKAIRVLDRIMGEDSELRELWREAGDDSEWVASVAQLRAALSA